MKRSLWRKYMAVAALVAIPAVLLVGGTVIFLRRDLREFRARNVAVLSPFVEYPRRYLQRAQRWFGNPRLQVRVVDSDGAVVAGAESQSPPVPWTELTLPAEPFRLAGHGNPLREPAVATFRLPGEPTRYALFYRLPEVPRFFGLPVLPFAVNFSSALLTALGTSLVFMTYLRRKARQAEGVLLALRGGNLGARFPISSTDELGKLMLEFNSMAQEIESLVRRLEESEKARTRWLEDLAHDLRTPIAGVWSLFQSIAERKDLPPERYRGYIERAMPEIEYLGSLVEDLCMLAHASDAGYGIAKVPVELGQLLDAEVARYEGARLLSHPVPRVGGDPRLLQRLFRNLLDNAAKFAACEIVVTLEEAGADRIAVEIRDDGPGFDSAKLSTYGSQRPRPEEVARGVARGAQSLGLGSAIASAIVRAHGGNLEAFNWKEPGGGTGGAAVRVLLPVAHRQSTAMIASCKDSAKLLP